MVSVGYIRLFERITVLRTLSSVFGLSDKTLHMGFKERENERTYKVFSTVYRPKRVTRNFRDRCLEVVILKPHYCHRVEHSLKCMETYFVPLISALKRIWKLVTKRSLMDKETFSI
jgi:hypothetical protein